VKKNRNGRNFLRMLALMTAFASLLAFTSCDLSKIMSKSSSQASVKYKASGSVYSLYRFKGTSKLLKFAVPDFYAGKPVTALMDFSLSNAQYLQELTIGKNISSIDVWAITNCPNLKSIKVSKENRWFKDINGVLYTKSGDKLLVFPNMNTTGFIIPDGVKELAANSFYKCGNLKTVKFPAGLQIVGDRAFMKCEALKAADLPDGLQKIGRDGFSYCHAMTYVYVPASVTSIGDYGFFDATKVPAIKMGHKSEKDLTLGTDWKYKKDVNFNSEIPVEWGASR